MKDLYLIKLEIPDYITIKLNTYWRKKDCVWFKRNTDKFGPYSNMYTGYPLIIGQVPVKTVEHAYQASKYPDNYDLQEAILTEPSPIGAKRLASKYLTDIRKDWTSYNLIIMLYLMYWKMLSHYRDYYQLLKQTKNKLIVEDSANDSFWGAQPSEDFYRGINMCGQLLMIVNNDLRIIYRKKTHQIQLPPIPVPHWNLLGSSIDTAEWWLNDADLKIGSKEKAIKNV